MVVFDALKNFFKKRELSAVFLLSIVLSFAVFGNGIPGEFVFDDATVIQNRGDIKDPGNFWNFFISPYHQNAPQSGLYRPFTIASYASNYHILGSSPAGFHIVNIVIHALNSFLVFWLVRYLFPPKAGPQPEAGTAPLADKNRSLSYATFLLFLTHPIHTEAVTSIVGRAELLAFFWSLTAIYFFTRKNILLSSVSFLFALLSKEIALMIWPVIFYIDWALLKNKFLMAAKRVSVFSIPLVIYSLLRYKALGAYFAGDATTTIVENPLKFMSLMDRILTAFKVLYMYLERLIWPVHLSADYSYNTIQAVESFLDPAFIVGAGSFAVLAGLLFYGRTRKSIYAFGSLLFLAPYIMISNLIKPVGTIMGERLMYFPSFGFVLLLSYILFRLSEKNGRKIIYIVLAVIIVFFSARTIIRNKDWQDDRTLFTATLKESPNSVIARTAMAAISVKDNKWDEAKEQLNIAAGIYEEHSRVQNLLGIIVDHDGDYELAEERYKRSLELNPDSVNAKINLAELYTKQGRLEEAGAYFKQVIEFYPVTEYAVRYAYIQIALNNPDEALNTIEKHLADGLNHPDISVLAGTAHFVKGDYEQALFFLELAKKLGNKAPEIEQMLEIAKFNIAP